MVAAIPTLSRDSSRENGRNGQTERKKRKSSFESMLRTEEQKRELEDIRIYTYGYSRDARAVRTTYQLHEYAQDVQLTN